MGVDRFGWRDITIIALALLLAWALYRGGTVQSKYAEEGKEAHDYLCYQKRTVIPKRIQTTLDYIAAVQAGDRKPVPGITDADLQNSIQRDEDALRNLSRVHCQ